MGQRFPLMTQIMAGKKVIAICQSGGEFETDEDGSMSYKGGVAHAMEIDEQMKFKDFKKEVAEMFNSNLGTISLKYFIPGNKKTLITISNEKDIKRMIKFQGDSYTADIYVVTEEVVAAHVPNVPARRGRNRSNRTTLPEAMVPVDDPVNVVDDVMDDTTEAVVLDATPHVNPHTIITTHIPVPLHSIGSNNAITGSQEWQDTITGVGQRFRSVHEFREALRKYAIANEFTLMYKKNENERVTAKCKAEGCPWRIHASRLATTQLFCIKKMNATHTCEGVVVPTGLQATRNWVAGIIKEKLKVNLDYNPKDIVNDIKQECGIQIKYYQAWRWKEIAKEQLQGSYKKAYNQLPFYCEKIMETNPAVMNCLDRSPYEYCSRYFTTDSYRLTYSESINPVPTVDSPVRKESTKSVVTVTPPSTRRPPGRPPAKPLGPQDPPRRKRLPKCSRCKVTGHKKSTCKEFLSEC
ncbi:MuDR family transposase [Actinidia rufa]|uniref:MuDR family transposase n=1 Tax=Actinidia rufa TaxID=165716 RepID=A0A7J0GFJ5_9ERIC|nr:MuDR family transposase [Actinidia rufa]